MPKTKTVKSRKPKPKTWEPQGWSYEELSKRWGLPDLWKDEKALNSDRDLQQEMADALTQYMLDNTSFDDNDPKQKQMASDLRKFLRKMAEIEEGIGYLAPLWYGLADIENDQTLLSYAAKLTREMWT